MFAVLAIALALIAFSPAASPDTILQTNAQGQRQVIQSQAIVIRDDSFEVVYKHFDLKQRRIEEVQLNRGSTPYQVVQASAVQRQQIVRLWKQFGYTATVTDRAGKTVTIYDVYLDFFPPSGGVFLESVPARTNLPILLTTGGADEVDFSDITSVQVQAGKLTVTTTNGHIETGTLIPPTNRPAIPHLMGITDHYQPGSANVYDFSLPLLQIREIRFQGN